MPQFWTPVQAAIVLALASLAAPASGHEFWIDPEDPSVTSGDTISAHIRVGENMKGSGLIFNPNALNLSALITPDGKIDIDGRMGDRPALKATAGPDGLHIMAHMTTASKLTYQTFEKFETFAKTHGETFAIDAHKARGLPNEDFTEAYFRCAKALIKVGDGNGTDQTIGLPFELTALDNPYTSDGDIRLLLTYKGDPKPAHQVDVFHRATADADADMNSFSTDENGVVRIPRAQGDFLVNAVVLEEPTERLAQQLDAVWISLWASTTYTIE